jgi:membrane-associated phospholipid phosphatase
MAAARQLTGQRHHPAMRALGAIGELGDQPPMFALSGAVLAFGLLTGRERAAAAGANMLLAVAAATAIKTVVKRSVSRTRPHLLLDEGTYQVRPLGPDEGPWHSFPSGHTSGAVAAARALARSWPEAALPAYAGAAVIAAAQIPTAHHYPSDVVAGAAIGFAADALVAGALGLAFGTLDRDAEAGREE